MTQDRRTFLKRTSAALGAVVVGPALPMDGADHERQGRRLDPALLRSVAEVVLPSELSAGAREEAVADFEYWADEYEPVAEMNHGYGTDVIRYGPPDPIPAWTAQLAALQLEAQQRSSTGFADLDMDARRTLLEGQTLDTDDGLPSPLRAQHIAVALMAHWFRSPDAIDRCYDRRIAERRCRSIDTAQAEPERRR